ncbi:MAG: c-type cytochrome biogenesis protein CcmI [Ectothiorhodospiraceae bacterium AqS1]|nr:c-type cytochrome biogenesis protein CcmI [Ectothiorhodospiraceae bacterium AqS1]
MITFWLLAALMIAAVLLWILPPLLRPSSTDEKPEAAGQRSDESERINLALYRERMSDLNREYSQGRIDKERYEILRDDLERGLIADIGIANDSDDSKGGEENAKTAKYDMPGDEGLSPPSAPEPSASSLHYLTPLALGLAIPIFGIVIYLQVGTLKAIDPEGDTVAGAAGPESGALSIEEKSDLERMANSLEAELEGNGDDAESWIALAQARMDLDDPGAAIRAYERAHAIVGDDPSILSDWAQAEIRLSGSSSYPESALARIESALTIDPDHPGALWIGGFASFQQGQREKALARWERLQTLLPQQSPEAQMLAEWLVRVRARALADADQGQGEPEEGSAPADDSIAGRDPEASARESESQDAAEDDPERTAAAIDGNDIEAAGIAPRSPADSPAPAPRIEVMLDIEPELAKGLGGDETIFVFARPAPDASGANQGSFGPPLAIVRTTLAALPTSVVLDDSSAMMAGRNLSSAKTVIVSARLSRTGTAERASGDIEGRSEAVPTIGGEGPIRIILSQVVP